MEIRKMAGWFFILMGVIRVLQSIHLHRAIGQEISTFNAILISLLFTAGAAFLWRNRRVSLRS